MHTVAGSGSRQITAATPRTAAVSKVAVVDSIPLFLIGFAALVSTTAGLRWVGGGATAPSALALCCRARPDIVVVDSALDPYGGLCQSLSREHGVPTVLLLVEESADAKRRADIALKRGACGVLSRAAEPSQLIEAIQGFHCGPKPVPPNGPLSAREHEVLLLIANGLANIEIGRRLYVSAETIRSHVSNILRKLRARNRSHAVAVAVTHGLVTNFAAPARTRI